jgi:hypothetical protein
VFGFALIDGDLRVAFAPPSQNVGEINTVEVTVESVCFAPPSQNVGEINPELLRAIARSP